MSAPAFTKYANRVFPMIYFSCLQMWALATVFGLVAFSLGIALTALAGGDFIWRGGDVLVSIVAGVVFAAPAAALFLLGFNRFLTLPRVTTREFAACALTAAASIVAFNLLADFQAAHQAFYLARLCVVGGAWAGAVSGIFLSMKRSRELERYVEANAERDRIAQEFLQARLGENKPQLKINRALGVKALLAVFVTAVLINQLQADESEHDWIAERQVFGAKASCERQPVLCELYVVMTRQEGARSAKAARLLIPQSVEVLNRAARVFAACEGSRYLGEAAGVLEAAATEPDSYVLYSQYVRAKVYQERGIGLLGRCSGSP